MTGYGKVYVLDKKISGSLHRANHNTSIVHCTHSCLAAQVNVRIAELRRELIPRREVELLVPVADDGGPGILKLLRRTKSTTTEAMEAQVSDVNDGISEGEWQSLSCVVTSSGEVNFVAHISLAVSNSSTPHHTRSINQSTPYILVEIAPEYASKVVMELVLPHTVCGHGHRYFASSTRLRDLSVSTRFRWAFCIRALRGARRWRQFWTGTTFWRGSGIQTTGCVVFPCACTRQWRRRRWPRKGMQQDTEVRRRW
jgi:hypothetical protein